MSNVYEEVNPIFNTAKTTLHQLAQAGVAEAAEYEKALLDIQSEKSEYSADKEVFNEGGELEKLNELMLLLRYNIANREIALAGNKNVLDLACGYTPRGRYLIRNGYNYVGGDLPAVVEVMNILNEKLMDGKCTYLPTDVTNSLSVMAAADTMQGAVTISSEGVMVYLTLPEKRAMWQAIRDVLAKHGGVWLTTDYEVGMAFKAAAGALLGSRAGELLRKDLKEFDRQSDASIKTLPLDEAERLLNEDGMTVAKHPFWTDGMKIDQIDGYPPEVRDALIKGLCSVNIWAISLDKSAEIKPAVTSTMAGLELSHSLSGNKLDISLSGRLDSISAPQLLELFDKISKENKIESITVSVEKLDYISSAGLRVLLRMTKHVGQENITLIKPNELVTSILEQTGFADMLGL